MNRNCHARQHSDQMVCDRCGLVWDTNDPEPPACLEEPKPKEKEKQKWPKLPKTPT